MAQRVREAYGAQGPAASSSSSSSAPDPRQRAFQVHNPSWHLGGVGGTYGGQTSSPNGPVPTFTPEYLPHPLGLADVTYLDP